MRDFPRFDRKAFDTLDWRRRTAANEEYGAAVEATLPPLPAYAALVKKRERHSAYVEEAQTQIDALESQLYEYEQELVAAKQKGDIDRIMKLQKSKPDTRETIEALQEARAGREAEKPYSEDDIRVAWSKSRGIFDREVEEAEKELAIALEAYHEAMEYMCYQEARRRRVAEKFERLGKDMNLTYSLEAPSRKYRLGGPAYAAY